jgi:hypothetical protein
MNRRGGSPPSLRSSRFHPGAAHIPAGLLMMTAVCSGTEVRSSPASARCPGAFPESADSRSALRSRSRPRRPESGPPRLASCPPLCVTRLLSLGCFVGTRAPGDVRSRCTCSTADASRPGDLDSLPPKGSLLSTSTASHAPHRGAPRFGWSSPSSSRRRGAWLADATVLEPVLPKKGRAVGTSHIAGLPPGSVTALGVRMAGLDLSKTSASKLASIRTPREPVRISRSRRAL